MEKKRMQMSHKQFASYIGVTIIASIILGTVITQAATPTASFYLSGGLYPQAHYTIWYENPNYFAKDRYGQVDFDSTNASYVLQSCINQLVTEGTAYQYGMITVNARIQIMSDLVLDSPIDLTDIVNLEIVGVGRDQGIELQVQHNGDIAFDFTNSRFVQIRNIAFDVASGYRPKVCIYLARGSTGASSGDWLFDNCDFDDNGGVTVSFIYNYGCELVTWRECAFRSNGTMININRDNWAAVNSTFNTEYTGSTSISMQSFRDCNFYCDDMTTEPIELSSGVYNVLFDHCYFGGSITDYAFHLNCTDGSVHKLVVKHCHFEMLGFTSSGGTSTDKELVAFSFVDNTINPGAASDIVFMDLNKTYLITREFRCEANYLSYSGATCHFEVKTLDYSYVDFRLGLFDFTLNATEYIRYSRIIVESSSHITCTSGYVAVNGTYFSNGASFP